MSTIRKFRIVQTEGSRQVRREVTHYNLQMIIAVGFKVNNERAVQFRKWAKITSLTIPASLRKVGFNAFFESTRLTSVTISWGVTTIGNGMFNYCKKLKTVKIPGTVTTIGYQAFQNCGIEKITIPKGVKTIKTYAFSNCKKMKSIKLPKSVKTIGKYGVGYKEVDTNTGGVKMVVIKGCVIKAPKKSSALKDAKKNKIKFKKVKK